MKSIAELKRMIVTEPHIKTVMDCFFDLEDASLLPNLGINLTPKDLKKNSELKVMFENMQLNLKDFFKRSHY